MGSFAWAKEVVNQHNLLKSPRSAPKRQRSQDELGGLPPRNRKPIRPSRPPRTLCPAESLMKCRMQTYPGHRRNFTARGLVSKNGRRLGFQRARARMRRLGSVNGIRITNSARPVVCWSSTVSCKITSRPSGTINNIITANNTISR